MSDDDDEDVHEHRGRSRKGGGIGRVLMIAGWIVAAFLAANLAWSHFNKTQDGAPQGFLAVPEPMILAVALWGAVVGAVVVAGLGILWTQMAFARREKPSLLWMRHAFSFAVVAAAVLSVVALDAKNFPRPRLAAAAAILIAAQTALFGYAAFREYRRALGGGGRGGHGGHRSRRSGDGGGDGGVDDGGNGDER